MSDGPELPAPGKDARPTPGSSPTEHQTTTPQWFGDILATVQALTAQPVELTRSGLTSAEQVRQELSALLPNQEAVEAVLVYVEERTKVLVSAVREECEGQIQQLGATVRTEIEQTARQIRRNQLIQIVLQWVAIAGVVIYALVKATLK